MIRPCTASFARRFRSDDGSELIEFALTAPVLLALLLGLMDGSRALYAGHFTTNVAREATRYAMVRGSTAGSAVCADAVTTNCQASEASIRDFVLAQATLPGDAQSLQVTATWPSVTATGAACTPHQPGCLVRVQVSFAFHFLVPIFPQNTVLLGSTSAVTIAR